LEEEGALDGMWEWTKRGATVMDEGRKDKGGKGNGIWHEMNENMLLGIWLQSLKLINKNNNGVFGGEYWHEI
jgi:hypothetical protein